MTNIANMSPNPVSGALPTSGVSEVSTSTTGDSASASGEATATPHSGSAIPFEAQTAHPAAMPADSGPAATAETQPPMMQIMQMIMQMMQMMLQMMNKDGQDSAPGDASAGGASAGGASAASTGLEHSAESHIAPVESSAGADSDATGDSMSSEG